MDSGRCSSHWRLFDVICIRDGIQINIPVGGLQHIEYIYNMCEECISGSMRYITSSYMATAFGSRPPWSSLHGLGEDSTASLNIRVLRPKIE